MRKTKFIIGIGSQRAGSTLLHRILDECSEVFMHPVKELHYFDTIHKVRHQDVLTKFSKNQLDREFARLMSAKEHGYIKSKKYKCFLRTNKLLAENKIEQVNYLDLFRPCLLNNEVVGEITPEYMILPEDGVKHMAEVIGKDAPIILITRDPVDRFISAFKLLKVYGNKNVNLEHFESELVTIFDTMPSWVEQQKQLSDYQSAFERFSLHFNNVLMISYDELVGDVDSTHQKLEACLGCTVDIAGYRKILGKKVNQIGETGKLSEETIVFLRENLKQDIIND